MGHVCVDVLLDLQPPLQRHTHRYSTAYYYIAMTCHFFLPLCPHPHVPATFGTVDTCTYQPMPVDKPLPCLVCYGQ